MSEVAPAAAPAVNVTPTAPAANPAAGSEAAAPQTAAELFDLVVDGKAMKLPISELKKMAELGGAASKRFQEAAQMRREAENVLSQIRDPKKAMKLLSDPKLGLDKGQITEAMEEWYNENVITPSQMTPEQRELAEYKTKLSAYEQAEKAKADADAAEEQKKLDSERDTQETQKIQAEILEALKDSGLPKTKYTAARLAYWMRVNESQGIKAPAALLVQQVQSELRATVNSLTEASEGDMLVNLLGENTVKKIRKHDLERIRAKRNIPQVERKQNLQAVQDSEKLTPADVSRRARDSSLWR